MGTDLFQKLQRWLPPRKAQYLTTSYIAFIYATLPIMRPILNFLKANLGKSFSLCVYTFLFLVAIGLIFLFLKQNREWKPVLPLLVILVATSYILTKIDCPEERIHFLEYAALGVLFYFTLHDKIQGKKIFLYIPILVFLVGLGDEIIQAILPNRFYDPRDILMNSTGGIIGELILITFNPQLIKDKKNAPST